MSRSNYTDDRDDQWQFICWRGAVASAIRGRRGQDFLKEMLHALDALPEKKLIAKELEVDGAVCAIGAVGKARNVDMSSLDPEDPGGVASVFGVSDALVREIVYENDEAVPHATPEQRYINMRDWVERHLISPAKQEAM